MDERKSNQVGNGSLDCVVLFDIDGTLLAGPEEGPSAGFEAMMCAIVDVAGKKGDDPFVDFAGRTDLQIARALLESSGNRNPSREMVLRVVDRYLAFLEVGVHTKPYRVIGFPGEAVEALRSRGALVGLGTGNVRVGGKVKLESAGIAHIFDWKKGGFGDDGESRPDLLLHGVRSFDPKQRLPVVIVGDTPRDVEAARAIGAKCIGIPYLHNDGATLKKAGADVLVDSIDSSLAVHVEQLVRTR